MNISAPTAEQIPQLRHLWQQAFHDSDTYLDAFFSLAYSEKRCRCVTNQGRILSCLYWFDATVGNHLVAYLYAISTDPAFQGRGLCKMLMEDTHKHLAATGYSAAILVPGEESLFSFYSKLGYENFSAIKEFFAVSAPEAIPLQEISSKEYARLRRKYLPDNSVIQEGATLSFLESQAQFFAGDNLLFAAAADNNSLFVSELLGDADAAPQILKTLNFSQGTFRAPGGNKPFAMYRSLTGNVLPTGYFGLALD